MSSRFGILRAFEEHPSTLKYLFFFLTFTMVVVAVAGSTGGLGRTLLDAIVLQDFPIFYPRLGSRLFASIEVCLFSPLLLF